MNSQEVFDAVCDWLRRPDASRCTKLSEYGVEKCIYYRNSDENRCAIGGILPIEIARQHAETQMNASDLLGEDTRVWELFTGVSTSLLDALQRVHDDAANWNPKFDGEGELKDVANYYSLVYTEPVKA